MDLLTKIQRMLNAFENDSASPETDYTTVYLYHDGNGGRRQVTVGRGFTDDGGNLKKVVECYITKGGEHAGYFEPLLHEFGTGRLADNHDFIVTLRSLDADTTWQAAQDEVFSEVYLTPALSWAEEHGFKCPLSLAVICDSFLHSGSIRHQLTDTFAEKKPVDGGDEKVWIKAYVAARHAWFARSTNALHNTQYRMEFFEAQFKRGNWNFDCPLVANGSRVC